MCSSHIAARVGSGTAGRRIWEVNETFPFLRIRGAQIKSIIAMSICNCGELRRTLDARKAPIASKRGFGERINTRRAAIGLSRQASKFWSYRGQERIKAASLSRSIYSTFKPLAADPVINCDRKHRQNIKIWRTRGNVLIQGG